MKQYLWWIIPAVVTLTVIGLYSKVYRSVPIHIDGETYIVKGWIWTGADALQQAGVILRQGDLVQPSLALRFPKEVTVQRVMPGFLVDGDLLIPFQTIHRQLAPLLTELNITLAEGDAVLWHGKPLALDQILPADESYVFQLARAKEIAISETEQKNHLTTSADTVCEALWENGVRLSPEDVVSLALTSPVADGMEIAIKKARDIQIVTDGESISIHTAADRVGEVLAEGGLALQGLDYSIPAETEFIPADGEVQIVKVREEVVLDQKLLPFDKEVRPDDEGELDSWRVVDPGQAGILVTRLRVRYEDGIEVSRNVEGEWQAQAPRNQVLGYGTKVVVKTEEVNGETIEYWRKITVYATSYSPCNSGGGRCYPNTASGLPVQRGVVGVIRSWYNMMAGQPVYIPGYGRAVIADIGAGVAGVHWIDLGFSDSDYIPYYWNVTIYFLTPVPGYIPALLP